jgi:hypothetical protein
VIWLRRKLGWLLCLAGGLALVAVAYAMLGLLPLVIVGGSPTLVLTVVLLGGGGLGLAKLGTVMCRE